MVYSASRAKQIKEFSEIRKNGIISFSLSKNHKRGVKMVADGIRHRHKFRIFLANHSNDEGRKRSRRFACVNLAKATQKKARIHENMFVFIVFRKVVTKDRF